MDNLNAPPPAAAAAAAISPAKNPVSELYEAVQALPGAVICFGDPIHGDELKWQVTLTVGLPLKTSQLYTSGEFPTAAEAKADAARAALDDGLRELARQRAKRPAPAPVLNAISLLYGFCAAERITIADAEAFSANGRFGWHATLRWAAGIERKDWFYAPAEFASADRAKGEAAKRALDQLSRHPDHLAALLPQLEKLPASERLNASPAAAPFTPTLPPLMSPQVQGQPLRAADGTQLLEGRHLELKGVGPSKAEQWAGVLNMWIQSRAGEDKNVLSYVTAFLNSGIAGRIVLGVHDSGDVQGIPMTNADKDQLNCIWAQRQALMWPPLRHDRREISEPILWPVSQPGSARTDLFLIVWEITPYPGIRFPYFADKTRSKAIKKLEATITAIGAEELTSMIIAATRAGLVPG